MHAKDSAEEKSKIISSNIELEHGDITYVMLLSTGSDQPINATESDVQCASHYKSDAALM